MLLFEAFDIPLLVAWLLPFNALRQIISSWPSAAFIAGHSRVPHLAGVAALWVHYGQ